MRTGGNGLGMVSYAFVDYASGGHIYRTLGSRCFRLIDLHTTLSYIASALVSQLRTVFLPNEICTVLASTLQLCKLAESTGETRHDA